MRTTGRLATLQRDRSGDPDRRLRALPRCIRPTIGRAETLVWLTARSGQSRNCVFMTGGTVRRVSRPPAAGRSSRSRNSWAKGRLGRQIGAGTSFARTAAGASSWSPRKRFSPQWAGILRFHTGNAGISEPGVIREEPSSRIRTGPAWRRAGREGGSMAARRPSRCAVFSRILLHLASEVLQFGSHPDSGTEHLGATDENAFLGLHLCPADGASRGRVGPPDVTTASHG